jgi:uncharacterized membrane protein YcaP (DUF421 family)
MVDNPPLLLMNGAEIIEENLKKGRVSKPELYSKLRESKVLQMSQIKAVVYETTGQISVLHSEDEDLEIDDILLSQVNH